MVATPHIDSRHGVPPLEVAERVELLAAELRRSDIGLELRAGGEVAPERVAELGDDQLRAIALGGSSWILLECPFVPAGVLMDAVFTRLLRRGFNVLLAHPERSPTYLTDPADLGDWWRQEPWSR